MVGDAGIYLFDFRIRGWFGFDASIKRAERCHVHYVYTSSSSSSSSPVVKVDKSRKKQRAFVSNVRYNTKLSPSAWGNTNERIPSDMLSLRDSSACVHEYKICTRAGDQSVLLKYQISGLGVTRAFRERRKKLAREKERKAVGRCSTRKLCARKGEERERARGFNHEEVQRELVSKLTRYEYTSSSSVKESGVVVLFFFKEEKTRELCFPVRR